MGGFIQSIMITILFLTLTSCGSYERDTAYFKKEAPEMSRMEAMKSMAIENEAPMPLVTTDEDRLTGSAPSAGTTPEKPEPENQRKRIYNGSTGLVVEDPPEVRTNIETMASDWGGYVEQSYADYLVLRVPAAHFLEIFETILEMGSVNYQQIDSWDVSDQYQDIQARLSTAGETRKRLYVLLERSTDPEERAKILREIGRLTEEIESIKQQVQILDSRIAFSRITVELIPRLQENSYKENIPFSWIAALSPLYPVSDSLETRVNVDPGEDFALFSKEDFYVAEDAYGTTLTISTVKNSPRGDSVFWQKALHHHLKDYYASATFKNLQFGDKEMKGIEFTSKDSKPFHYFVGLIVDNKKIHIIEIFSPDKERDFSPLYRALKEGECR